MRGLLSFTIWTRVDCGSVTRVGKGSLCLQQKCDLWIGTAEAGLFRYDTERCRRMSAVSTKNSMFTAAPKPSPNSTASEQAEESLLDAFVFFIHHPKFKIGSPASHPF
ncbi:MAG: hypothetical protein WCJ66_11120 [Verrucomicrobiota bacterium]